MPPSGAEETGEDGEGVGAGIGARAERDFACEDGGAQCAFGVVIGGRHAGTGQEGEELLGIPFRRQESVAQVEGLGMGERGGAEGFETTAQDGDKRSGALAREARTTPLPIQFTHIGEEPGDGVGEGDIRLVRRGVFDELDFGRDFLGGADDMGQTCLAPASPDRIVDRVAVGDDIAVEVIAQNGGNDLGGARAVDVEEVDMGARPLLKIAVRVYSQSAQTAITMASPMLWNWRTA